MPKFNDENPIESVLEAALAEMRERRDSRVLIAWMLYKAPDHKITITEADIAELEAFIASPETENFAIHWHTDRETHSLTVSLEPKHEDSEV